LRPKKYTNFDENSTSISRRSQKQVKKIVLRNKTFLAPIKLKIIYYKRNEIDGNEMKETVELHNISNPSIDITGCFIIQ
jgi:hypothetical protein